MCVCVGVDVSREQVCVCVCVEVSSEQMCVCVCVCVEVSSEQVCYLVRKSSMFDVHREERTQQFIQTPTRQVLSTDTRDKTRHTQ